jgi:hypothetical protein
MGCAARSKSTPHGPDSTTQPHPSLTQQTATVSARPCLREVVGHEQDRIAALETGDERLDDTGGEGIEGAAGLIEEQHLGA